MPLVPLKSHQSFASSDLTSPTCKTADDDIRRKRQPRRYRRPKKIRKRQHFPIFGGQGFVQVGFYSSPPTLKIPPPRVVHGHRFDIPIVHRQHTLTLEIVPLPMPTTPYIRRKFLGKQKVRRRRRIREKSRRKNFKSGFKNQVSSNVRVPALQG